VRIRLATFWLLCTSLLVPLVSAGEPDGSIIWYDSAHTRVYFISGPVLDRVSALPIEEAARTTSLPQHDVDLAQRSLDGTRRAILAQKNARPELKNSVCARYSTGIGSGPIREPKSLSLPALIRTIPVAMIGKVKKVTPGLLVIQDAIGVLVFFEVTEILRDTTHTISVGDNVGSVVRGGTILYKKTALCTESDGAPLPAPGDEILITGYPGISADPQTLGAQDVFAVESGQIVPNGANPYLSETQPVAVRDLRLALAATDPGHE
jgi:hypothetical protein